MSCEKKRFGSKTEKSKGVKELEIEPLDLDLPYFFSKAWSSSLTLLGFSISSVWHFLIPALHILSPSAPLSRGIQ
jgi:hypothetical protein